MIALIVILLLVLIAFSSLSNRRTQLDKFNDAMIGLHNAQKAVRERKRWRAEDEAAKAATPKGIAKAARASAKVKAEELRKRNLCGSAGRMTTYEHSNQP